MKRRRFLELAAVFGITAPVRAANAVFLRFEYPVDSDALARVIPRPFEVAEDAQVRLEIDGDRAWMAAAVRLEDRAGWLLLRAWTSDERTLRIARESLGQPFFPGEVEADSLTAEIRRDGRVLFHADFHAREADEGAVLGPTTLFALDFRARPDWTEADAVEQAEVVEIEQPGRAAISTTWLLGALRGFELPETSPDDPLSELRPSGGFSGAWAGGGGSAPLDSWPAPATVRSVDPEASRLPLRYGRPKTGERVWTPSGRGKEATAWRLTPAELEKRRERPKLRLAPLSLIEIDAMIGQEAHRALLPPICRTAGRPMIKILGIRSGGGDVAAQPFSEVWLFAYTIVAARPAWYAVSHIVSEGGDQIYGRETFGYPTKRGRPSVVVTAAGFTLALERRGREVAYAEGAFQGFSTGTTLLQNAIVGLRASRGGGRAELVYQTWLYQGRRSRVDPRSLRLELSPTPAEGRSIVTDPWHELGPLRPIAAIVMDSGGMQRSPGEVLLGVDDFAEYYRERGDGILPWEPAPAESPRPKLRVGGAATTRS